MIKLKDLIYEAWKTPLGTPDEVTEILYRIVEKVESKGLNPKDYIGIIQKKFRGWRETCWVIQDLKKPDRFLAFSPFTKDWYYSLIGFKNKFPASDAVVNAVIRQWAEILKEETDNPHLTMGNFKSDYEMVCRKIKNELSKTDKLMPIKRVSDRDLFELYGKYTKYKRVDEDLLNKVVDQLKENTIRIIVYNKLIFGNWYYKSKIIKTDTPMGDETENDYKLAYNLTGEKWINLTP